MQGLRFNILSNDLDMSIDEIYFVNTVAEGLGKDHKTQTLFLSRSQPPRASLILGLILVVCHFGQNQRNHILSNEGARI